MVFGGCWGCLRRDFATAMQNESEVATQDRTLRRSVDGSLYIVDRHLE